MSLAGTVLGMLVTDLNHFVDLPDGTPGPWFGLPAGLVVVQNVLLRLSAAGRPSGSKTCR